MTDSKDGKIPGGFVTFAVGFDAAGVSDADPGTVSVSAQNGRSNQTTLVDVEVTAQGGQVVFDGMQTWAKTLVANPGYASIGGSIKPAPGGHSGAETVTVQWFHRAGKGPSVPVKPPTADLNVTVA